MSVPITQKEASIACGLTKSQMYLRVILPQVVLVALPSFGTTTVALLQDTSLAFTIGIVDVVGKARAIGAVTYHTLEGYVGAAILFITLSIILERVFDVLEKRMNFTESKKSSFQLPRLFLIKNKEIQLKKVKRIEKNLKELNCNIKCIKNFKNLYRQRITQ